MLGCLWYLARRVAEFDHVDILDQFAGLQPQQWALALAAVALAFYSVARQERVILRHMGLMPDRRQASAGSMAAAGVSQCLGFGPVIGALLRARLVPGLNLKQSFLVSVGTTIGFFAGAGVTTLVLLALRGSWGAAISLGALGLALVLRSLAADLSWRGLRLPSAATALSLLAWVALDLVALSFAFWALIPLDHGLGWGEVGVAFLIALGLALMTGSPAGTGPFEALILLQLPEILPESLIAGLLAFRGVAYALPAGIGAAWVLTGNRLLPGPRPSPALRIGPEAAIQAGDRAEVLLTRQGVLALMSDGEGQVWASTVLGLQRVLVGEPSTRPGRRRSLSPILAQCRHEGRGLLTWKIGPRQAVEARRQGARVLRVALEAVIDPARHSTEGPAHAGLRRKLRHAAKAGVAIVAQGPLPLDEMAEVAADWAQRHGGERGLTTGRWSADYVAGQRVLRATGPDGRTLAFVTFHATPQDWVLDLIRFRQGVPDGTLYLLVQTAIETAACEGAQRLSLAAVPVEGFGLKGLARLTAKSRGLQQFKHSFAPQWQPRYATAGSWIGLGIGLALLALAIHLPRPAPRRRGPDIGARRRWQALRKGKPPLPEVEDRRRSGTDAL